MTLVLAGAIGGKYSITTGDTRRTEGLYWEDKNTGEWGADYNLKKTDHVVNKVVTLTNFVTYASAGNSDITGHIINILKQRVSKENGILIVSLKLQGIIAEMRKEIKSGSQVPFFYKFLDEREMFGIVLNGFTNEIVKGKSYFGFYISGLDEDVITEEIKDNEYKYVIWGPSADYAKKKGEYMNIDFNSDVKDTKALATHFLKVHAVISHLQPKEVSELCDHHTSRWISERMNPYTVKKRVDLSKYHKELGLVQ